MEERTWGRSLVSLAIWAFPAIWRAMCWASCPLSMKMTWWKRMKMIRSVRAEAPRPRKSWESPTHSTLDFLRSVQRFGQHGGGDSISAHLGIGKSDDEVIVTFNFRYVSDSFLDSTKSVVTLKGSNERRRGVRIIWRSRYSKSMISLYSPEPQNWVCAYMSFNTFQRLPSEVGGASSLTKGMKSSSPEWP